MKLDANIKIIDSDIRIGENILNASSNELKKIFQKAKVKIHAGVINLVIEALSTCPEILSLQSGKLKYDFGLPDDPTQEIIYAIANSTYVYFRDFKIKRGTFSNVLSVYVQPQDFGNLLSADFSKVITDAGQELPWLKWLLLEGDAVVVTQYSVQYGQYDQSRSGGAIMVPSGFYKVPSEFSGSIEDNFITRALSKYEDRFIEIVRNSI